MPNRFRRPAATRQYATDISSTYATMSHCWVRREHWTSRVSGIIVLTFMA